MLEVFGALRESFLLVVFWLLHLISLIFGMDWLTGVRERGHGAVFSWCVAQGWGKDHHAEFRCQQECVGSALWGTGGKK